MTVNTNGNKPTITMVYTFGFGHKHPVTGESLANMYTVVSGESGEHCRAEMLNRFGRDWAFEYTTAEAAGVERFKLRELPQMEWPPSSGRFSIEAAGSWTIRD